MRCKRGILVKENSYFSQFYYIETVEKMKMKSADVEVIEMNM